MATQTFTKTGGTDNNYHLFLSLTSTPNTEGNYSDVAYVLAVHGDNTACAYQYTNGNCVTLTIGDASVANTTNFGRVAVVGITTVTLLNGTIRIPHNSDGRKTIAVSAVFKQSQNSNFNFSIIGEMVLDSIARASIPTLSASSTAMGTAVTITTNRTSTSFIHTARYTFASTSGTIATGITTSTSWTIPLTLANQIPNAASGTGTIYLDTYQGSTLIGTQSVPFTATVPESVVPSLTVAIAEAATIPSGITDYIQGQSKLKVTATGTGQYSATIKSYKTTVENTNYSGSPVTTNTLSGSGTIAVKVVVTDSRGRTTTKTQNVTVTAYSVPKITTVQAYRCTSATDSTADKKGTYICVIPKGSVTSLGESNSKKCVVYYKKASATSYSSKTLAMEDFVLDTETVIFAAEGNSSYDIYVVLSDAFSSVRFTAATVTTTSTLLHIGSEKDRMGIGKQAEVAGLDIGWPTRFREYAQFDKPITSNVYATGDVAANASGNNPISLAQFYNQLAVIRGSSASGITYSAVPTVTLLPANADGNPAGSNLCILITFQIDSAEFGIQIGLPLAGATGIYKRECINGTWVAWRHLN